MSTTSDDQLSLRILHGAMVLGTVIFLGVAFFLNQNDPIGQDFGDNIMLFYILSAFFVVIAYLAVPYIVKPILLQARQGKSLNAKMIGYRNYLIIKWATMEAAVFFALVFYFLTGEYFFMGTAIIGILASLTLAPSTPKTVRDLKLEGAERSEVEGLH
ncbi:MAG: hypothetical protein AAFQ83_18695 [Bacteroidota bacterium]